MSHSPTEEARAWDFGMVSTDLIAFPVCVAVSEEDWSTGKLESAASYWHERNRVRWGLVGHINYFTVSSFRAASPTRSSTKGATEGSETSIAWASTFSTRSGSVESVDGHRVAIRRTSDGHKHTWNIRPGLGIYVAAGDRVEENQIIASTVRPLPAADLRCVGRLQEDQLSRLLQSPERTQRFTGTKLARIRHESDHEDAIKRLTENDEEDVYIRLEGLAYLASVCGHSARDLFESYRRTADEQNQLEVVIAIGETATEEAVSILSEILQGDEPYFLRSAAAWCLSRIHSNDSVATLLQAFRDVDPDIREEALEGMLSIGGPALPALLSQLQSTHDDIAAGCAEALRQQRDLPGEATTEILRQLHSGDPSNWAVWVAAHLPRDQVATAVSELQESAPHLHYAISVLWSFLESWVARRLELSPRPNTEGGDGD